MNRIFDFMFLFPDNKSAFTEAYRGLWILAIIAHFYARQPWQRLWEGTKGTFRFVVQCSWPLIPTNCQQDKRLVFEKRGRVGV